MKDPLIIADKTFSSRLFTGTGKFASTMEMRAAILASESELVTVALKRVDLQNDMDDTIEKLKAPHIHLLPNTSGAKNAKEAIFAAQLAREALQTNWLKLEIHPDPKYLMPDPIETLQAAEELVKLGFNCNCYDQIMANGGQDMLNELYKDSILPESRHLPNTDITIGIKNIEHG